MVSYDPNAPDAVANAEPWSPYVPAPTPDAPDTSPNATSWMAAAAPPPPPPAPAYGQSYDEGYQPARGRYASAAGDNGQSPWANVAGFGGSLVGWGALAPSLQPDSGAPFAQQQHDANKMIVDQAMASGIPGGLQMIGEGAALPEGVSLMHGGPGGEPPIDPTPPEASPGAAVPDSAALSDATAAGAAVPGEAPYPDLTPEESAALQAQLIQQEHDAHYGGQAAGQVARSGEAAPDALRQPDYTQTPDEVVQGNAAAYSRAIGDVRPADVVAPYESAHNDLLQRIQDLQPLQEQQAQNVTALRSRQFGGLGGALESGPGGRQGANYAMAAMRGAADQVSFQPLSEVMSPEGIDNLYDHLSTAAKAGAGWGNGGFNGAPFTMGDYATAKTALDNIVDGSRVPPPSGTAALEKAFPGITASLKAAPINNVPPLGMAGKVRAFLANIKQNPVAWANNTARSIETIGDVASPGRLAPTAGLYDAPMYGKTWAQTAKAIASNEGPQAYIQRIWDSVNADPSLSDLKVIDTGNGSMRGITVDDMFDPDHFGMHGAGYDPYSGASIPSKGIPNATSSLPGGDRTQLLNIWNQVARPQMLREAITNRLASGQLTPEMLQDPLVQRDLGRGIDLITGHASWRPFGDSMNTWLNFGNWTAAQLETIARAAVGTVQDPLGSANVIPGVHVNSPIGGTSFTNDVARTAVGRLAALQTSLAVAAGVAQGLAPTDKRLWKDGHAVLVVNPTGGKGPQIPGYKPDTQIDTPLGAMLGHIVSVGRATYEGATGGSRFGGTAPTNALERVGGAIGNPLHPSQGGAIGEAEYWGRGMLAFVPKTVTDLLTHSNMSGEKPSWANEAPLPINASGFVGDNAKAPGANIIGSLGGRVTEPSPSAALDNALTANPKYGAGWYQLSPAARDAARNDPAFQSLVQARDANTLQKDTPAAKSLEYTQQAQDTLKNADQYLAAGKDDRGQPYTAQNWRNDLHTIEDTLRIQKNVVYGNAGTKPGSDPVLDGYYKAIDAAKNGTNNVDHSAVDAYRAGLSAADNAYIDKNSGLSVTSPTVKQYRADQKAISDSGYFNLPDQTAATVSKQLAQAPLFQKNPQAAQLASQATDRKGMEAAIDAAISGLPKNQQPMAKNAIMAQSYNALLGARRDQFLSQHRDLIPTLQRWGYGVPAKAVAAFGAAQ